jgi:putative AlgH/UPF0301 family transcriptional regulator
MHTHLHHHHQQPQQQQQPQEGEADMGAHTTSTQVSLNVWVLHGMAKWKAGQLDRELRR